MANMHYERWLDSSSLNLARRLQSEFSIPDKAFSALCETLWHVRNLSHPKKRRSRRDQKVAQKFAEHVRRTHKVYNELDAQTQSTVAALLANKISINKAPPKPAGGAISVDLGWRKWKARQVFEGLAVVAGFCASGPGRGRDSHKKLRESVDHLRSFWENDLARPFDPHFDVRGDDPSDPDLKRLHPLNGAAQFCCTVFAEIRPSILTKSIARACPKKVSSAQSRRRVAPSSERDVA